MTSGILAEKILKIIYGGRVRTSNGQITIRQIELAVNVERDFVVRDFLNSEGSTGKPLEDAMFTRFESQPLVYDQTRRKILLELPYGYMSLPDDKGIRVLPIAGRNLFRRVPSNYGDMSPELGSLDGVRIPWMVVPPVVDGNRRICFPTLNENDANMKLDIDVVIGDSRLLPASQVGIPDGLQSIVESRVLSKYKAYINDQSNDGRDQA